jgi:hypothetical protein
MIQKDYILRMLEQLGKILAKVILNKTAQNHESAITEIETAFINLLGLDPGLLDKLSAQSIAELLGILKDKPMGCLKCLVAARLLKTKTDVLSEINPNTVNVLSDYLKALNLYLDGLLNLGYSELDAKAYFGDIAAITDKLGNSIPQETRQKLAKLPMQNPEVLDVLHI